MKKFDNIYMNRFGYFNIYVIKGKDGDILIDTGFIIRRKKLKRWLDNFNIKLVVLTHAHVDHIWNVSYIKKLYDCEVVMCELDIDNINNSNICSEASKKCYRLWTKLMNLGMRKFVPKNFLVDYEVNDGDVIDKFGIKLDIIGLPGHTEGSIGIMCNKYLFCGDALVNRNRKRVAIAFQNQNNEDAKKAIDKIYKLKPEIIFVGHDREIKFNKFLKSFDFEE